MHGQLHAGVLLLCLLCFSCAPGVKPGTDRPAATTRPVLRVGAAAIELDADDSMPIAGGIAPGRARGQEGALRATAIVLDAGGGQKLAIVSCDVLFVPGDLVDRALARIERSTHLPPTGVMVTATHTHHAPSVTALHGYGPNEKFARTLEDGIVAAVERANVAAAAAGAESQFLFHLAEEKTIGANSRLLLKDGTIYWVGDRSDAVRPTGPFDPELPVLAFRSISDNRLRALLYNHSTHTIGTRKGGVRSPSFYGLAAQELEAQLGGSCAFLEGASGSTHNITGVTTGQAVERLKVDLTAALEKATPQDVGRLVSIKQPFAFKVRTFDEAAEEERVTAYCRKRIADARNAEYTIGVFRDMRKALADKQGVERRTTIQVMVIGEVALVGVPAEYFTSLGVDIKRRSPFKYTYICELANDWIGYLPDREGHTLGGYQTWTGFHSYADPGTGERIADEVVKLLKELATE